MYFECLVYVLCHVCVGASSRPCVYKLRDVKDNFKIVLLRPRERYYIHEKVYICRSKEKATRFRYGSVRLQNKEANKDRSRSVLCMRVHSKIRKRFVIDCSLFQRSNQTVLKQIQTNSLLPPGKNLIGRWKTLICRYKVKGHMQQE